MTCVRPKLLPLAVDRWVNQILTQVSIDSFFDGQHLPCLNADQLLHSESSPACEAKRHTGPHGSAAPRVVPPMHFTMQRTVLHNKLVRQ